MEWLDIVDENGIPTGEKVKRERAHREGIRHRTSHVWLWRIRQDEKRKMRQEENDFLAGVELLVQRRSMDKDSHPGCLDISSAGHIPAGSTYVESALRELSEELGIKADPEELIFCGKRRKTYRRIFHETLFFDNQVSNVYLMYFDGDAGNISFQSSEISEVLWMPFHEVYKIAEKADEEEKNEEQRNEKERNGAQRNGTRTKWETCIALEEMNLLQSFFLDHSELLKKKSCLNDESNDESEKERPEEERSEEEKLVLHREKKIKLTTLCYIKKDDKYLMLYRNKKKNDQSEGKWMGVGGKLEEGESPEDCVVREVREETGLILTKLSFRGIVTFVSDVWDHELMFLYTSDSFTGDLTENCAEGELAWIPKSEVLSLPAWEGDRFFLKPLLSENENETFHIKLVYEGEKLVSAKDYGDDFIDKGVTA